MVDACMNMKTIVCIEDNLENLKVLRLMLNRLRPQDRFMSAVTAEDGLAIIVQTMPDLVLMDIDLPGMNGYEALQYLRENPETRHITVIAISAHAMHSDVSNGLSAGFNYYMTKPVDMRHLKNVLNNFLASSEVA